jgi:hypothetical protein
MRNLDSLEETYDNSQEQTKNQVLEYYLTSTYETQNHSEAASPIGKIKPSAKMFNTISKPTDSDSPSK